MRLGKVHQVGNTPDPDSMRYRDRPVHTTRSETERTVRKCIKCTPSYYRVWAAVDAATDRCIGMVNYHSGHIRNKRADIGYTINPAHQRQGITTEAVSALLDFCFGELGLHRLQAFIDPDNLASRTLVEKLGFCAEGRLRDNLRVGDKWHDNMLYPLPLATVAAIPDPHYQIAPLQRDPFRARQRLEVWQQPLDIRIDRRK